MTVFPDISEHQSNLSVDWFRQWPAVIIRAHSGFRPDHKFAQNWQRAREAGIPRGVYGYVEPGRPQDWQAREMIRLVGNDGPELGYWSDLEEHGLNANQAWVHYSTLPAGRRGVYANGGDYNSMTDDRFAGAPWWAAGYPNVIRRGRAAATPMLIHQFRGAPLDLNRGDIAQIARALNGGPIPTTPSTPTHSAPVGELTMADVKTITDKLDTQHKDAAAWEWDTRAYVAKAIKDHQEVLGTWLQDSRAWDGRVAAELINAAVAGSPITYDEAVARVIAAAK